MTAFEDSTEEHPRDHYNRWHGEPVDRNKAAAMTRKQYGLTGDYDTDLAAGKIDANAVLIREKS